MANEIEQLDRKYNNEALATLLIASAFNRALPKEVRMLSAIASKRLQDAPEVGEGATILSLNPEASNTLSHCLGLYDVTEADCPHFANGAPSTEDVERLRRLVESSNLYVVLRDTKAFEENEQRIELEEATPVLSDVPEDPQDSVGQAAAPQVVGIFDRLAPAPVPQGAFPSEQVARTLQVLEDRAAQSGISRESLVNKLVETRALMGEVITLARA